MDKLIHKSTTLRTKYLDYVYTDLLTKLKTNIRDIQHVAITTDIWGRKNSNENYIGMTSHMLSEDLKLIKLDPGIIRIGDEKTGNKIHSVTNDILNSIFNEGQKNFTFVTDRGSNMLKAFNNRIDCAAHMLNTVVSWVIFNKDKDQEGEWIKESISFASEVVENFNIKI